MPLPDQTSVFIQRFCEVVIGSFIHAHYHGKNIPRFGTISCPFPCSGNNVVAISVQFHNVLGLTVVSTCGLWVETINCVLGNVRLRSLRMRCCHAG